MRFLPTRIFSIVLASSALACAAETGLTSESPFRPVGGSATAATPVAASALQLAGITSLGSKTYVLLIDSASSTDAKKGHGRWIAVGSKVDDIEVISCDIGKNEAVVRVGPEILTLTLRKPSGQKDGQASAIPLLGPTGSPLPQVAPLVTREEKEREARMLVSDLLDIGMSQRKAYEEAQRKAAEEAAKRNPAKK